MHNDELSICDRHEQAFRRVDEMVARIERYKVEPAFSKAVADRSHPIPNLERTDQSVFRIVVGLIAYSNNAKSDAVDRVMRTGIFETIFDGYDLRKASSLQPAQVVQAYWPQIKSIRFKYKIERMIDCASSLLAIQSRHGSFMQYLQARGIPPRIETAADIEGFWEGFDAVRADFRRMRMPYLRNFVSLCHLFLWLGYDCAKPDSAVMKTAVDLGLVPPSTRQNKTFPDRDYRKVIRFMQEYALCRSIRTAVVDLYFLIHEGQRSQKPLVRPEYYLSKS